MIQPSQRCMSGLLAGALWLAAVAPAAAQISAQPVSLPSWNADRNSIAYDARNEVYLFLEWGTPLQARFLNKAGATVAGPFAIAEAWEGRSAWSGLTFGGTVDDPTFLVTYTAGNSPGDYTKYARLVRFRPGISPLVSARSAVTFIGHEWYASEKSQAAWHGSRFVVGSRVMAGGNWPEPQVHHVDLAGNVTGGQLLGDHLDFYGSPAVSCATSGVCMAIGYAGGIPFGGTGGTYARRFDAATLQPLSAMTYLDDHSAILQDQAIVFATHAGHFLSAWWRAGFVDTRVIHTDGTMGPLMKNQFGLGFAGDVALTYNGATQTSLIGSKYFTDGFSSAADYGVAELSATGEPVNLGNVLLITPWDLKWPEYFPAIAANSNDGQWLVSVRQTNGPRVALITRTGSGHGGPGPLNITGFGASTTFPAIEGTTATWTATATGGQSPLEYQFWRYTDGQGWSVGQAYSGSNTFSWSPGQGTHAVQVWVRSSGSPAAYDAYAPSGFFTITPPAPRITSLSADKASPVPLNTPVTWTVHATGGTGPLEYQFWRHSPYFGWQLAQDYSSLNTYTWFPPDGTNRVQAWVRTVGSSAAYEDWRDSAPLTVALSSAAFTSLSPNFLFHSPPGAPITWTATAIGGSGPLEYKFFLYSYNAKAWFVLRDWSPANHVTWTPTTAVSGQHALQAWVRTSGSSATFEDWAGTPTFVVTDSTSLVLSANRSLTGLRQGDVVTWTANVAGGGPWEYRFFLFDGSTWSEQGAPGLVNAFTWTASAGTRSVQVWIRRPGTLSGWERWDGTPLFVVNP